MAIRNIVNSALSISSHQRYNRYNRYNLYNLYWLNQDIARICKDYRHQYAITLARHQLAKYITYSNPMDWANWIQYSVDKYTKIQVVHPLSSAYTIYLLNWLPGQASPIHGHPPGGCIMGVLRGTLKETIYPMCKPSVYNKQIRILTPGVIGYINDSIGFHSIENLCNTPCNSMHIYFHNKPDAINQ